MQQKLEMSPPAATVLNIAHFNDVYQVSDQKIHVDGQTETINVSKFATLLAGVTAKWQGAGGDGGKNKNGLVVFSGDLFSPSVESSVTRGNHMPAIANGLGIDISVVGNHEFDFGYPRLKELLKDVHFPWLLSNIVDTDTGKVPEPMKEFHVLERAGIRIGLVGLVEKEWIATITGWPETFQYRDMAEVGRNLSVKLRDSAGEFKCDVIIAVTHCRIPNDLKLAKALLALSPAAQATKDIASEHGVDLLLGGHDHVYWISKGVSQWDGFDLNTPQPDAGDDQGDVLIVKSGTDYQDLSEVVLTLKPTPAGSVRKQLIHDIRGVRHVNRGDIAEDAAMKSIVDNELQTINAAMQEPICITEVQLDVRSTYIRLQESVVGNWITDCLRTSYDEALVKLGYGKTDVVIAGAGTFRGDRVYEPGPLTFGDLMGILPFSDPTVVIEVDANTLWDALESGLSRWPAQEGRFPALSGLRVTWDSSNPAGQRVLGIWLLGDSTKVGADGKPELVDKEEVLRTSTRKYLVMCREYISQGGDGYDVFKGQKLVIAGENGQSMCALVRKFLLGAQYLNTKVSETPDTRFANLGFKTQDIIKGLETRLQHDLPQFPLTLPTAPLKDYLGSKGYAISLPKIPFKLPSLPLGLPTSTGHLPNVKLPLRSSSTAASAGTPPAQDAMVGIRWMPSRHLFTAALAIAEHEDVGLLDPYERSRARRHAQLLRSKTVNVNLRKNLAVFRGSADTAAAADEKDAQVDAAEQAAQKAIPIIHPFVDGRLKDVAPAK